MGSDVKAEKVVTSRGGSDIIVEGSDIIVEG